MKKYFTVFLFTLFTMRLFPQPVSVAIIHVNVIAVTSPLLQSHMTVMIAGDKITDIGKTGKLRIPTDAMVIDASRIPNVGCNTLRPALHHQTKDTIPKLKNKHLWKRDIRTLAIFS